MNFGSDNQITHAGIIFMYFQKKVETSYLDGIYTSYHVGAIHLTSKR